MATEFGRGGKPQAHTRHKMFELAQVWTPADNAPRTRGRALSGND